MENARGRELGRGARLLIALSVAALCFAAALFFTRLYDNDVDNYYISLIVNGLFDEQGQCQYLHPLLSRFLRALSRLLPGADAFLLTGHALIFLALFWLSDLLLRNRCGALSVAAVAALFLLSSLELRLFNCNYTVQAAFFAATGLVSLSVAQRKEGAGAELAVGALFFAVGYLWRRQGALLALPYLLLETAANLLSAKDRALAWRRACRTLAPCLALGVILVLTDEAMNAAPAQQLARAYNKYRVQIIDYPMLPWEEVAERADPELTEVDYYAAQNYMYFDTERITADTMKKIAALGSTTAYPFTLRGALAAARGAKETVFAYRRVLLTGGLLAVLSLWGLIALPKLRKLEILLCGLGTLTILLYFVMRGRTPERLWLTALLPPLGLVMGNVLLDEKTKGRSARVLALALLLFSLGTLAARAPELTPISPQLALDARGEVDEGEYEAYLDGEAVIVWHTLPFGLHWHVSQGKLPSPELMRHLISAGDWIYGQPYYTSCLERLLIPNPAAALLERDDVYFAALRTESAQALLEERAGGPVEFEQVDLIEGVPVYKVTKK